MRIKILLFSIFFIVLIFSSFNTERSSYSLSAKESTTLNTKNNLFKANSIIKSSKKNIEASSSFTSDAIVLYNKKISSVLNKYRFNGTVLVAKQGEVIFKKAQGYSNFKTKEPLTENTSFQLASVSKQFTAMAIMILHEKGKLQYNDYVTKYIPDFPYKNITIKHLLSHTSGLPNYIYLVDNFLPKNKTIINNEDVLNLIKTRALPLNFKPGNRFLYSNTGYVFLALLIERVSKTSYKDFLKANIFVPLGMNNTYVYDKKTINTETNRALSYTVRRKYITPISDDIKDDITGDKGVFSTIDDLYKWDKALYDNKLVSESTINQAYELTTLNNNKTGDYGYGWRIKNDKGLKIIYHNGWWHGYKTSITRFIEDKNTIIVLNNTNSHIKGILDDIKKILYPI